MPTSSLRQCKIPGQIHGSHPLYTGSYSDYAVRKLECSFTDFAQIVSHVDLIYVISPIYLNVAALSDPNSLILTLTSLLVCKLDHIQNPIFCTLVNSGFTYCFVDDIFIKKYNIPTTPTLPIELTDYLTISFLKQLPCPLFFHLTIK